MNPSPGIIALYWLLGSFAATAAWIGACHYVRRTARRSCPCGTCGGQR